MEDGQTEIISTDSSWVTTSGKVTKSEIYYGEDLNDYINPSDWQSVILLDQNKALLQDRLSLPIKIMERLPIQEILETPAGEQVLDFWSKSDWLDGILQPRTQRHKTCFSNGRNPTGG